MSRLTLLHINIIGAVASVIVAAALWFTIITSAQDQIKQKQSAYDGVKARADKLPMAQNNLKNLIATDPVPNLIIPLWAILAYLIMALMPKRLLGGPSA